MNPQGFSLLYMRKYRADHRSPIRREDEMPLNFMISNATYRLVTAAEQWLNRWEEWRRREDHEGDRFRWRARAGNK